MTALLISLVAGSVSAQDIVGKLRVVDGVSIRIYGIDAPETDQTCTTEQGLAWACGSWVRDRTKDVFQGRQARCAPITTDRYDRVVARCQVGEQDFGQVMVEQGFAFAYRRYAMDYDLAEKAAAVNDRGLHAHNVQNPSQFRKTRAKGRIPTNPACKIKGNISGKGVRIFHSPGQADYERTGINERKGERWFCTAEEALNAGWRAAKR
jgi:endonuclease YncB( thermonuclease family)